MIWREKICIYFVNFERSSGIKTLVRALIVISISVIRRLDNFIHRKKSFFNPLPTAKQENLLWMPRESLIWKLLQLFVAFLKARKDYNKIITWHLIDWQAGDIENFVCTSTKKFSSEVRLNSNRWSWWYLLVEKCALHKGRQESKHWNKAAMRRTSRRRFSFSA